MDFPFLVLMCFWLILGVGLATYSQTLPEYIASIVMLLIACALFAEEFTNGAWGNSASF